MVFAYTYFKEPPPFIYYAFIFNCHYEQMKIADAPYRLTILIFIDFILIKGNCSPSQHVILSEIAVS